MINLINISKSYQPQSEKPVEVFEDFNMAVSKGEMVAITGRSGSGKSTLLAIIAGLMPIDKGNYYFCEELISIKHACESNRFRRNNLGVVVQNFALIDDMNVINNITLALSGTRGSKRDKTQKAMYILERLDLLSEAKKYPQELSGGQCQRVALARAIVSSPRLLIADEPTGCLDVDAEENVMNLLKELNQSGMTILIATHNPYIAQKCHRIVHIQKKG